MRQNNYHDYINADSGLTFAEFLGIERPRLEYGSFGYGGQGNYRYKSPRGEGEWKPTMKEAKASYKADMYRRKALYRAWLNEQTHN